ncbi:MAG TPA: hypothetical protein VGK52_15885 [Polyangia bacterium]|jgi:hypothetical protein
MRPNVSKRHKQTSTWRVRAVQLALALAGTGIMTAIAAAAIGANQGAQGDGAMAATILAQRISEGLGARPAPGPQSDATTRDKILAEAATLEADMNHMVMITEKLRVDAYKAKDIIRLNTVTGRLDDMKSIMMIAIPAFKAIRQPGQDLFVMRAKISTIRQGWERMKEALSAAEAAEGDSVDSIAAALGPANAETSPSEGSTDPTAPPTPSADFERPGEASPYR